MQRTEWTTKDFGHMSWHDAHVHGFRIVESDEQSAGTAELYLDIDYILEWVKRGEEGLRFVVAQATLHFHDVFGLRFSLDYAKVEAGMCAFSIAGIEREIIRYPNGHSGYKWVMNVNWPAGFIEFTSSGFTQRLVGEVVRDCRQSLPPSQRKPWLPR